IGTFEREVYPWIRKFSAGIASAIDVGAADGEYTLFFLSRTSARRIYTFEPSDICRAHVQRNIERNAPEEVVRMRISSKLVGARDSENSITLNSITDGLEFPCFIKMDVDGAEVDVLKGATSLLTRTKVRWLIETHSKEL